MNKESFRGHFACNQIAFTCLWDTSQILWYTKIFLRTHSKILLVFRNRAILSILWPKSITSNSNNQWKIIKCNSNCVRTGVTFVENSSYIMLNAKTLSRTYGKFMLFSSIVAYLYFTLGPFWLSRTKSCIFYFVRLGNSFTLHFGVCGRILFLPESALSLTT